MAFLIREHYKKDLRKIFGLTEDSLEDIAGEVSGDTETAPTDDGGEDTRTPEDLGIDKADVDTLNNELENDKGEDTSADAPADETKDQPSDSEESDSVAPETPESAQVPGTGDEVTVEGTDDNSKVTSMFKDIGKPETDYGLTNPNNIRLSKFRFTKSGIDINQLMNDVEKKLGLSVDKIIYRLTPEQYESYKDKGKDIRNKFDLIKKREKNIVMFNARIPIYYLDKNTNKMTKIDEGNPNLLKNAFTKIDDFMTKRFGEEWIDNLNAIDFLQGIKVNFAATESITPNMITSKFFEDDKEKLIPFNKLYVSTPKAVEDFVRENKENQNFLRSAVYRTLAAGYLESSTDSNGVFAILKGEESQDTQDTQDAGGDTDGDTGGKEDVSTGDELANDLENLGSEGGGDTNTGEEPPKAV
jgi:hypothetical protein